jgi:hypothetical protein
MESLAYILLFLFLILVMITEGRILFFWKSDKEWNKGNDDSFF